MGRRTKLAQGIFSDRHGLAAVVKVGHLQREKRFPADTPLRDLARWRDHEREALRTLLEVNGVRRPPSGTLRRDGDAFLSRRKGAPAYKADRSHLRAWYAIFGDAPRRLIAAPDVANAVETWRANGVAARTIRHRCRVLRELWHAYGGPRATTPIDGVKLPPIPAAHPVPVPIETLQAVAKQLRRSDPVASARFAVLATTGQRPAQVMRVEPADVDLVRGIWFVRPAKGGAPIPLPMNTDMRKAWKAFAAADAWGPYDTSRFAQILRQHGWPAGVRPYQLRHTFAIDHLLAGADLGDLQGLLGHKQIQTTRNHYAPILLARLLAQTKRRRLKL